MQRIIRYFVSLEVSAQDLLQWSGGTWLAVDMRDESSCAYGMMEGALRISEAELLDFVQKLPVNSAEESARKDLSAVTSCAFACLEDALQSGLPVVLYCKYGRISRDAAEAFREKDGKTCAASQAGTGAGRWRRVIGPHRTSSGAATSKNPCARHLNTTWSAVLRKPSSSTVWSRRGTA